MKPQTAAAALVLLLVCAAVSPRPAAGDKKRPRCTEEDKARVLRECGHYTRRGRPSRELPHKHSACCKAAERLDMQCVVDLLSEHERRDYEQPAIIALEEACD